MGCISRDKLISNLKDAGCNDETIRNYFSALDSGNKKLAMSYIEAHRRDLLREFHKYSGCIDCLDYFVTQTKKDNN